MARCHLLELCQELRDIVYEYALLDDKPDHYHHDTKQDQYPLHPKPTDDTTTWTLLTSPSPPAPAFFTLLRIPNRQLHAETTDFLTQRSRTQGTATTACATLRLDHPLCNVHWTSLPTHPSQIQTLDLTLRISNLYATAIRPPSPALAQAVQAFLSRYETYGPHLGRQSPLVRPLKVEKLRITLAAPAPEQLDFVCGNPWMELRSHYSCLKWALGAMVREGEMPELDVEVRVEGKGWESVGCGGKGDGV